MQVPSVELTPDDLELIEFARQIVDANTDGEDGVYTMGADVRATDGRGPVGPCGRDRQTRFDYHPDIRVILPTSEGVRSVRISDLMPLATLWGGDQ